MVGDLLLPPSVEVALQRGECSAIDNPEHGARNRDRGSPKRIVDLDDVTYEPMYGWTGGSRLACFRLRAGNIEVYEPLTVSP